jgi:proteasome accessory factor B
VSEAIERLVNLAMYLATARAPVSAAMVRAQVEGYPAGQDEVAFLRMFERDKDELREAGFSIESDSEGAYRLDASATFAASIDLSAEETAAVRAAGLAMLADPTFPLADELRLALTKLATDAEPPDLPARASFADEEPVAQGEAVAALDRAIIARKRVGFSYTNALGCEAHHEIEPYGLFVREGRWYLVGRDTAIDEVRVYAISRARGLEIDAGRPKTPDFERPADFDVASFIALPFQYGAESFAALVRFAPDSTWRAASLTGAVGALEPDGDALVWRVTARDGRRLLRWVVESGPGLELVEPVSLANELRAGLARVAAHHV